MVSIAGSAAVAALVLASASPAPASESFGQAQYPLATSEPSHGVGSAIGSPSGEFNAEKPLAVVAHDSAGRAQTTAVTVKLTKTRAKH